MVNTKLVIDIPAGLHLRPISVLCNRAIDFKCTVTIRLGDKAVNAKSVLGVLSACAKHGDEIELICDGPDEAEALKVLGNMIKCGLGDEFIKK
ncbi:MAG: Phosphotransferase System HPr (HPr) Family [Herbinix sp.]|jgi:phosphocarrier protein|nr:Phosphotransferase System HPr (HPr) Family [Herbinix sp.]